MSEDNNELDKPEEKAEEKAEEKLNIGKEIWEWFYTIAIAVLIAFFIKTFLFDIVRVDGSSMYPTLVDNDRLIVTKFNYTPKQGDIIILDSTYKRREAYFDQVAAGEGKEELNAVEKFLTTRKVPELKKIYYVKRVIALPGQTVDLKDGKVYVDGAPLDEPYYKGETLSIDASVEYPITVDDDMVFVMGDNRMHSTDSRSSNLGLVPEEAILGKSQIRVWPFTTISFTR